MNQSKGIHCILELMGCQPQLLDNETFIRQAIVDATTVSGSTLLSLTSHKFSPQGVTALALLSESHISIHTWPEIGYAAADVFTCGSHCNPQTACGFLVKQFKSTQHKLSVVERGPCAAKVITFPKPNISGKKCKATTPHQPYG